MSDNSINFFSEEIEFELSNPQKIHNWITSVIKQYQKIAGNVNYIFCDDKYLHNINLEYLSHDTYTDIITFDNSEEEMLIEGDIYISIERVKENAQKYHVILEAELQRVMIHGILHLLGFDDHSEEDKKNMRSREQECLLLLENN